MASNQTPVYGLNQWSLEDGIIMAEFNADNQKTEQALVDANATIATLQQEAAILRADRAALEQAIAAAKAESKSGDTALQAAINTAKNEAKSGDNTLLQALNAVKATIPKIASGTYVGDGTGGADNPTSLTFPFEPKLLIVSKDASEEVASNWASESMYTFIALRGNPGFTFVADTSTSSSVERNHLQWSGTTVRWWHDGNQAKLQFNAADTTYHYFAIG